MSGLEVAAFVVTVAAVVLTVRENAACWPVGLVSVTLYAVVFGRAQLYASMGLQAFFFATGLYGWWSWRRGGAGGAPLRVTRAPRRRLLLLAAGGVVFALGLGALLARLAAAAPFVDAGVTSFSLVAQLAQARKWLENWAVWIAVDAVAVGLYTSEALFLTAALYGILLALAVAGHLRWRRALA